jgi:hypothetical protein
MISLLQPTHVMVDPFEGITRVIDRRRWVWALLLLVLSGTLSAAAFATRWDARPATVAQLQEGDALAQTTEQQLEEKVVTAGRVRLVLGVLKAVVVVPLGVVLLAAFLKLVAWLFGKKALFSQVFSAAVTATLPLSLYRVIFALCALRQPVLGDDAERTLVPSNLGALANGLPPAVSQALAAVDFFNLWSMGLLGLGFAAAAQLRRGSALALILVLYAMYVGVFMIGLPALSGGGQR